MVLEKCINRMHILMLFISLIIESFSVASITSTVGTEIFTTLLSLSFILIFIIIINMIHLTPCAFENQTMLTFS